MFIRSHPALAQLLTYSKNYLLTTHLLIFALAGSKLALPRACSAASALSRCFCIAVTGGCCKDNQAVDTRDLASGDEEEKDRSRGAVPTGSGQLHEEGAGVDARI